MVQSATNGGVPTDSRCQVWVGNLPYRVRWQDLKDLMRKAGVVLRSEVALTVDSRSRGYGTVLFARREDAFKAIQIYNGFQWMTRTLEVHIDAGDPQGVIAISEANRQTALQQQAQHYQLAAMQQQQYAPPPQSQYRPGPPQAQIPPMQPFPAPYPSSTSTVPPSTSSNSSHSTPDPASPVTPPSTLPPRSVASSDSSSDTRPPANYPSTQTQQADEATRQLVANQQFASMMATLQMGVPPNSNAPILPPNYTFGMMQPPPAPPPGAMNELIPFFLQQQQSMQLQRPPPPSQSNSYAPVFSNRHLFVGNLPFNCQWQELKDLMRAAGAVLRAEVAQADGRSRGFGSVLFESAESSQRAVAMFNGYDYNGRILKVHFDKFSQTAPSGAAPNNLSSLMPSSIPPPPMQMQQQPFIPPPPFSLHFPPASAFAALPPPGVLSDRRQDPPSSTDLSQTPIAPTNLKAPLGRISMPPPYPFPGGPMSPLQSRMMAQLPLMTPSMPAFTLGAYPSTPPLYPQMFSPGLGAFSPGLIRPGMVDSGYGRVEGGSFVMNPAPGAPLHRGQSYNHYQTSIHPMLSPGVSQYPHPPQVQYDAPTPRGNLISDTSRRGSQGEHGYFPIVDDPANAALLNPTNSTQDGNGRGSASAPGTTFASPALKSRSNFPSPPLLISSRSDGQLDSALSTAALHSIITSIPHTTDEESSPSSSSSSHHDPNEEEEAEATAQSIAFFSSDPIALARRKSSLGNEKEPRLLDVRRASYEGTGLRVAPKFGSSIWGGDV